MANAPKPETEASPVAAEPVGLLAKIEKIDDSIDDIQQKIKHFDRRVETVENNNRFVIIILFATYFAIVIAVAVAIIVAIINNKPHR